MATLSLGMSSSQMPPPAQLHQGAGGGAGDALSRCKRRINFGYAMTSAPQPAAVARRNARERNRVKQVNQGFANLRQHIPGMAPVPTTAKGKKLSKVETLRCAVDYIKNLQQLVDNHDTTVVLRHHSDSGLAGSLLGSSTGSSTASRNQACLSPTGSDGSVHSSTSSSPTPSYGSEGSTSYVSSSLTVYDNYENYEPMSPEDEVLLDAISWWQQSQ